MGAVTVPGRPVGRRKRLHDPHDAAASYTASTPDNC